MTARIGIWMAIAFLFTLIVPHSVWADIDPATVQKLVAEDGATGDFFGGAVSVNGDTALIAAGGDDEKGAAYIFVRSEDGTWSQQAKLTALDGTVDDYFGWSVSVDGDTALIGSSKGAVYVFIRLEDGTWAQQAKLTANDGKTDDYFGCSVSVSGDTALIGAYGDDYFSGSAYVFVRSGTSWNQQAKIMASERTDWDLFGISVSLDSNTALIGAMRDDDKDFDAGAAYIFVRSGTSWNQQAKLTASEGATGELLGISVSLDSNTALIGAVRTDNDTGIESGSAYVFVHSETGWIQQASLTAGDGAAYDYFGNSVSVDGNTALIGAGGDDDKGDGAGSAYVFVRSGTVWTQQVKLNIDDGAAGDNFGYSSVSLNGGIALIGAGGDDDNGDYSGAAYVFTDSIDADNDGVTDTDDQCLKTALGDVVDSTGCSIAQLCPCNSKWKNHGQYIQCVQRVSGKFLAAKLITKKDRKSLLSTAAQSQCGRKSLDSRIGHRN